jgi:hypothetical protein
MKLEFIAAAVIATVLIMPVFAQDKAAAETPKADAPKAQTTAKGKPHSHLEDRQGIKPSEQPVKKSVPMDKTKHFHPRDK